MSHSHHDMASSVSFDTSSFSSHHSSSHTPSYELSSYTSSHHSEPAHQGHHGSFSNQSTNEEPHRERKHHDNKCNDNSLFLMQQMQLEQTLLQQSVTSQASTSTKHAINSNTHLSIPTMTRTNDLQLAMMFRIEQIYQKFLQFYEKNKTDAKEKSNAMAALKSKIDEIYTQAKAKTMKVSDAFSLIDGYFKSLQMLLNTIDRYNKCIFDTKTKLIKNEFLLMNDFERNAYNNYAKNLNAEMELTAVRDLYSRCAVSAVRNNVIHANWNVNIFQTKKEIAIDGNTTKIVPRKVGLMWDYTTNANQNDITYNKARLSIYRIAADAVNQTRWSEERTENYRTIRDMTYSPI